MAKPTKYKDCMFQQGAILNKKPVYAPSSHFYGQEKDLPDTILGEKCIIGANAIVYAGTVLGDRVFVADGANIRENCQIGSDTIIGRNVTVELNTKIGRFCKIQTAAHITGDCVIEDYVFIGPEVCTMNDKYMGASDKPMLGPHFKDYCRVGANATILAGITIGKYAVVGAGSVVTKDVPDYEVWVGNPARFLKKVE